MKSVRVLLSALTVLACASSALAQGGPRIVNGLNTHDFPTTGALLYPGNSVPITDHNTDSWCSGTLIGCSTFLTAAHCVEDDTVASHYRVFFQHSGVHEVASITPHPSYTSPGFPEFDVAVVKLASPVTGIEPTPLNLSGNPPFSTSGTIAGFGQTSGGAGDYGIKRQGDVTTEDCSGVQNPLGNTELVCWTFTNPVGPAGDDSNTCNGDSGGPLFADLGGGEVVIGVTSGGNNGSCRTTDESYDANVYGYRAFISGQLGADSTASCGTIPAVGDADVTVTGNDGNLSGGNTSDDLVVNLSGSPQEVRFVLKGEDNGSLDVDFYVKQGLGASTGDFDCKSDASGNTGTCIFSSPANGDWSIHVARGSGSGEYQVTTTVFGGNPPVCGNNIEEVGEDCDGTDDDACPGLCTGGCICPAPVCGNDLIESGETCDGADPGTCPTGTCDLDCSCPEPICGNNVEEDGEECDGTEDSACSGLCDGSCSCPSTCNEDDLFVLSGKSDFKNYKWKLELDNFSGTYDGLDPRSEFTFLVTQAPDSISTDLPGTGWEKSRPEKGKYQWKGDVNGVNKVKVRDRTDSKGVWRIQIKGKGVPGAEDIDVIFEYADVQLTMDGVCAIDTF